MSEIEKGEEIQEEANGNEKAAEDRSETQNEEEMDDEEMNEEADEVYHSISQARLKILGYE